MSGKIGILTTTKNNKQNKNLYFKAINVLETTYNSVKLSYLTNLDAPNNINSRINNNENLQEKAVTSETFKLSGQEGIDWVQEANRYLIKNTCKEITISGATNKNIETESGTELLTINLNNVNSPNSEIRSEREICINIKENTTNNLKKIDCYYKDISINANNNINCILNLNENSGISIDGGSYEKGIIINGGIINASGIIGCSPCTSLQYVIVNDGIINTPQFGGGGDAYTSTITINGGMLFTNTLGCTGGDGNTGNVKFLGGVVRFNYWESYKLSEISDSAVIITPTQSIFDTLKSKNKGLLILSEQFASIDSLKVFDINNDAGKITIKESLTVQHGSNMTINKNCKVIANNLYLQDANGNIETRAPEPVPYTNSILINNGELTISPGTKLYINCFDKYYLDHENNGIIYNFGEIDGKEYLKGTGRIVELDLTAEINGELYNDITVDKTNRTITINNLNPETDYDINLIASLEPYIERSKTIKQRTIKAPPATLMAGEQFRQILEGMSGFEYVTAIRFEQKSGTLSGIDVSESKDGRIKSRISGSILYVEANGEIFANSDCSTMFGTFGYPDFGVNGILNEITFNNFNTSKVTTMQAMFYSCKLLTNLDVSKFDTSNVTNMYEMFYDCRSLISIKGLENFNTSKVEDMSYMFDSCYYLSGEITIMNPNITNYTDMFDSCTSKDGQFIINYIQGCKGIAENMIATFSSGPIIPFNGLFLGTEINILNNINDKNH